MFDTYERMAAAGGYLRQRLLPSLPERSLVVLAGRRGMSRRRATAPVAARLSRLPSSSPAPGLTLYEAATRRARARGLAGLAELPVGSALRLAPCRSVHTFGMRFALDLLWLGADGRVVRVDRGVAPRRVRTCMRARAVVEARAGEAPRFLTCFRVS